MLQSVDELPQGAQRQHQVVVRSGAGNKLRGLAKVELACLVVGAVDQEGSESDLITEVVGSQECIFEQGCAYASSLRALIDGEARKDENGAWVRASSRFESLWEVAP